MTKERFIFIDLIRSLAIYLMVFFHFSYDLNAFRLVSIPILDHWFWFWLPRLIVFLFLFCVGLSMALLHSEKMNWETFLYRLGKIIFWALTISLITKLTYPDRWVYFGTLHTIAVCSLMGVPFLRHPRLSLLVSLAFFIPFFTMKLTLPWFTLGQPSMDYIPPFPWLGAVCLGIFVQSLKFHQKNILKNPIWPILAWPGKHALSIYLIHQPIIFALLFSFQYLWTKFR